MSGPPPFDTQGRGPNWTHEETSDLIAIWGDISVQQQFARATRANAHVFQEMSWRMQERGHRRSGHQCRVKAKALRAQFVRVQDHNRQPGAAPRTMPFLRELERILAPTGPSEAPPVFCSTGGLEEPAPGAAGQEDSPGEGTSWLPHQVPARSPPSASPGSSDSPGHHLPQLFQRRPTSEEDRVGMSPADASSGSSREGPTARPATCRASPLLDASASRTSSPRPGTSSDRRERLPHPPEPAAGHGGEPPGIRGDGVPRPPAASAGALRMRRLRQRRSQDRTALLDRLVTVSEEQLEESRTWHRRWLQEFRRMWQAMERSDREDREARRAESEAHHALLQRLVEALEDQRDVVRRAAAVAEDDQRVTDSVLALAMFGSTPSVQAPTSTPAPAGPWQPPAGLPHAPQ
ncbi:uncharacterized protein LOC102563423 isoform X1 [Alligator mississippiensis]|uniref:uncharacterized protein LOC102563423 isoform X1 n=1 Tax=Alligator mississippiensis TaxID=8496 RepID=UPI0003D0AC33|nr:uncharacterized protein LOC102563423 isoform X1 [Alligator mississippiensis]XP_014462177.1 uncharacterized protein LOC102563423 isoform X1 [Alligator mississippiensis]XP_014462178.1 uncharacterized protein LOC102563423 isoform X1 [Alligator mississippiensis]XP_019345896.1 uncharacterized protein LOC102563423 isoform X1 [Alligator mississippiensis]XP_019345897.1 uncharacterized protein LOC102563423 isoform X1 [Alligator mississippiensis]XP_019345898.1 uncharacterized protein LOC102563423 iso